MILSGSAARKEGSTPSSIPILSNSLRIRSALDTTLEGPGVTLSGCEVASVLLLVVVVVEVVVVVVDD